MVPSSMDRNKREGAAESIHVGQQAKHSTSGRDISVKESGEKQTVSMHEGRAQL